MAETFRDWLTEPLADARSVPRPHRCQHRPAQLTGDAKRTSRSMISVLAVAITVYS
jgi:hypothetical protein